MDAADAARMSDPDRNPHFRRRWAENGVRHASMPTMCAGDDLGPIGLALLEAWRRKQQAGNGQMQMEATDPTVAALR